MRSFGTPFFILCSLCLFTLFFINFYAFSYPKSIQITLNTPYFNASHDALLQEMLIWPSIIEAAHSGDWDISHDMHSMEWKYLSECWKSQDWFKMVKTKKKTFQIFFFQISYSKIRSIWIPI